MTIKSEMELKRNQIRSAVTEYLIQQGFKTNDEGQLYLTIDGNNDDGTLSNYLLRYTNIASHGMNKSVTLKIDFLSDMGNAVEIKVFFKGVDTMIRCMAYSKSSIEEILTVFDSSVKSFCENLIARRFSKDEIESLAKSVNDELYELTYDTVDATLTISHRTNHVIFEYTTKIFGQAKFHHGYKAYGLNCLLGETKEQTLARINRIIACLNAMNYDDVVHVIFEDQ